MYKITKKIPSPEQELQEYQANLLDYVQESGNTSDPEFLRWLDWYTNKFFEENPALSKVASDPFQVEGYKRYFANQVLSRGRNFNPPMETPEARENRRRLEREEEVRREIEEEQAKLREVERMKREERERENIRRRISGLPSLEQEEAEEKRQREIENRRRSLEQVRQRIAEARARHDEIISNFEKSRPSISSREVATSFESSPDRLNSVLRTAISNGRMPKGIL